MGYKEDISINTRDMEQECATHPTTHFEYGKKHADALHARRLAEQDEQEAQAAADEAIRSQYVATGEKVTETAVRRAVEMDPVYQKAKRTAIVVGHDVNVLAAALEALNAKTKMLGNLVQMQLAHWQAEPNFPREVRDRQSQKASDQQIEGLKGVGRKNKKPNPVKK